MGASGNQPVQNAFQGASQAMQQAGQTYGNLAGFQAPTAQAAQIGPVGSMATANMQQYMNPYTQNVIERGQQDIMRQQQQAMNQLGAQATAAGAFGGSRLETLQRSREKRHTSKPLVLHSMTLVKSSSARFSKLICSNKHRWQISKQHWQEQACSKRRLVA